MISILSFLLSFQTLGVTLKSDEPIAEVYYNDTIPYAILNVGIYNPFNKKVNPASFTEQEIETTVNLINLYLASFTSDTSRLKKMQRPFIEEIKKQKYFKQFFPAFNEQNEKEIWINNLCSAENDEWKKSFIKVHDGGTCYYSIKVNLTKKSCYDFTYNGNP